jgi:hypothetical protein
MTAPHKVDSFDDFWPHYVGAHRSPVNRGFHYVGTSCALLCVAAGVITWQPWYFAAAPIAGYGPAWLGHFFVEHNRPATFDYVGFSLLGDFKMLWLALRRKMALEVTRLFGAAQAARAAQGASDAPSAGDSARGRPLA